MDIEILKLLADIATPVAVVILGLLFLRRIESVKSEIARQSDFRNKWSEMFLKASDDFMKSTERSMALLYHLQKRPDKNDEVSNTYMEEIVKLALILSELDLTIKRTIVFAPTHGPTVSAAAQKIMGIISSMLKSGEGNFDQLATEIGLFNKATRLTHAELLRLPSDAE